jgi:hypothetical protein
MNTCHILSAQRLWQLILRYSCTTSVAGVEIIYDPWGHMKRTKSQAGREEPKLNHTRGALASCILGYFVLCGQAMDM